MGVSGLAFKIWDPCDQFPIENARSFFILRVYEFSPAGTAELSPGR
jgi:hypothetical protein